MRWSASAARRRRRMREGGVPLTVGPRTDGVIRRWGSPAPGDPLVVDRLELTAALTAARASFTHAVSGLSFSRTMPIWSACASSGELAHDGGFGLRRVPVLELRIAHVEGGVEVDDEAVDGAVLQRLHERRHCR